MPSRNENPIALFDLLVVGLGPAGVACLLQAHRDGLRAIGFSDEPVGGLVRAARRLDNLPAFPGACGASLAHRMQRQLAAAGVILRQETVVGIERRKNAFLAALRGGEKILSRTVVLATGTRPRPWEFDRPGVHRDARTLPRRMHGLKTVVVGGGEAALDTALTCRDRGAEVRLLVRRAKPRAPERLIAEARSAGIEILTEKQVTGVTSVGRGFDVFTGQWRWRADILVACIGRLPRDELLRGLEARTQKKIVIPKGIFLAGDLVRGTDRYVASAMGDGQRAALAAAAYLKER